MLSELLDMGALVGKAAGAAGISEGDIKALSGMYGKAKAISAKASKYVLQYPVACTDAITDYKTGLAIAKQVEFDCARFYILASGLDQVIDSKNKDTISAHLNNLVTASESYRRKTGFNVKITEATEDDIAQAAEAYSLYNVTYQISKPSRLGRTFHRSLEDVDTTVSIDDVIDPNTGVIVKGKIDAAKTLNDNLGTITQNQKINMDLERNELEKQRMQAEKDALGQGGVQFDSRAFEKLGKAGPTVINVEFILNDVGGQRTIRIPLAFKSDLQFIPQSDIQDLLKSVNTPGKSLRDFIKITTGQTSFLKDFLLGITEAKRDVDKEKKIGRIPIFRRLMEAKSRYRIKSIFEWIPIVGNSLKNLIAGKNQKDLPMCTVVVTERDFEVGTGIPLNKALSGNKIIQYILDTYMLLGFAIVDELNDVGYFFYSGEEGYYTIKLSDMGTNTKDGNITDKLTDVLSQMSKKMTRY